MATYAIGDIHGGLRALQQLLEIVEPQSTDQLIFLGDIVDGWSESAQTVDFLMHLSKEVPCQFVKGNHDEWCEKWLKLGEAPSAWIKHGGAATVASYKDYTIEQKQRHIEFWDSLPYYHIDDENRLFIHAGFTSLRGPQKEKHSATYFWDRTLWELAMAMNPSIPIDSLKYPKRLKLFKEIYIGHTPTTNYREDQPMHEANVWNLDTGAAFKGKLSAIEVGTENIWQSDEVWTLYPDENGRN